MELCGSSCRAQKVAAGGVEGRGVGGGGGRGAVEERERPLWHKFRGLGQHDGLLGVEQQCKRLRQMNVAAYSLDTGSVRQRRKNLGNVLGNVWATPCVCLTVLQLKHRGQQ
jgi:hypothetical protein